MTGDDEPDKRHHTDIKVDAIYAEADVKYPTDCGLLEDPASNIMLVLRRGSSCIWSDTYVK